LFDAKILFIFDIHKKSELFFSDFISLVVKKWLYQGNADEIAESRWFESCLPLPEKKDAVQYPFSILSAFLSPLFLF
jgi:hypothetical protein